MSSKNKPYIGGPPTPPYSYVRSVIQLGRQLNRTPSELNTLALSIEAGELYLESTFERRGKSRLIEKPDKGPLQEVQRRIQSFLESASRDLPTEVHGFVRGRSIVTNATMHLGATYLIQTDIKSFYMSVTRNMVFEAFVRIGIGSEASDLLSRLVCRNNHLPTGTRCSPVVSNLVMHDIDAACKDLAALHQATYTRYADDITFSGDALKADLIESISEIVLRNKLSLNPAKTALRKKGQPFFVTGLAVSDERQVRLSQKFKRNLRTDLYFATKNGSTQQSAFNNQSLAEFKEELTGRLYFANSVESGFTALLMNSFPLIVGALMPDPKTREAMRQRDASQFCEYVTSRAPEKIQRYQGHFKLDLHKSH